MSSDYAALPDLIQETIESFEDELLGEAQLPDFEYEEDFESAQFFGRDVIDTAPDLPDNEFEYLSQQDQAEILAEKNDELGKWEDIFVSDPNVEVSFVLDEAVKEAWEILKDEVNHFRKSLDRMITWKDYDDIELIDLIQLVFGEMSEIGVVLRNELGLTQEELLKFLATVCIQSAYKESPSTMFHPESLVRDKLPYKDQEEYIAVWRKIATKHKITRDKNFVGSTRRSKCLWEVLQKVINNFLRDLSIVDRPRDKIISLDLDDDKVWIDTTGTSSEDNFGIRRVIHNRDNRRGFNIHSTTTTATIILMCMVIERVGDKSVTCFRRIFSQLFGVRDSEDEIPDLSEVRNLSDRGYTVKSTALEYLLPAGCDFNNTVMRIKPFPYVWGMKVSSNDTRTELSEKGAPALFLKQIMHHDRLVTCSAFRTGTGNISAIVSTLIHEHQWEGICLSVTQRIQYENNTRNGLDPYIFRVVASNLPLLQEHQTEITELFDEMRLTSVDVLTIAQGSADWHWGRKFSATSSQTSAAFCKAFILYQNNEDWCNVAKFLFGSSYYERFPGVTARGGQEAAATPDEEDTDGGQQVNRSLEDDENKMIEYFQSLCDNAATENYSGDKVEAVTIILDRVKGAAAATNAQAPIPANLFTTQMKNIRKEMIQMLLSRVDERWRPSRGVGDGALQKWFEASNSERVYFFHSKDGLIRRGVEEIGKQMKTNMSAAKMIEELVNTRKDNGGGDGGRNDQEGTGGNNTAGPPTATATAIKKDIIKNLLDKSFLKHYKGEERETCKLGHRLELPVATSWMEEVNASSDMKFKIVALHTVGLVSKKGSPWAKDSVDFVASVYDETTKEMELWGVEIKSRVAVTTMRKEKNFLQTVRKKKRHLVVDEKEVEKMIKDESERYQILHHAYVYNFDRVALVIGNKSGNMIHATTVKFTQGLRNSYEKVTDEIKNIALDWAYSDDKLIPDEVIEVSDKVTNLNGKEALYSTLKLWRAMFSNLDELPRPTIKRIIPSTHAKWNANMGGSDALTKIIDDCHTNPPRIHSNFESVAVGRCLSNLFATIFKLHQITTAKKDLNFYKSTQHYRNAASHRCTYKTFLLKSARLMIEETTKSEIQAQQRAPSLFQSILPCALGSIAPAQTGKTPKKMIRKKLDDGTLCPEIRERIHKCIGFPVEIVSQDADKFGTTKDPRRKCIICNKTKTRWRCAHCKFYFCMENNGTKYREKKFYEVEEREHGKDIKKIYGKSCFHESHQEAAKSYFDV